MNFNMLTFFPYINIKDIGITREFLPSIFRFYLCIIKKLLLLNSKNQLLDKETNFNKPNIHGSLTIPCCNTTTAQLFCKYIEIKWFTQFPVKTSLETKYS